VCASTRAGYRWGEEAAQAAAIAQPAGRSLERVPLLLLFDWFCDWSHLILRYQLTQDEDGLGLADMRKVLQYLAQKSRQAKVLEVQAWILEQRQKVLGKANLNRVLLRSLAGPLAAAAGHALISRFSCVCSHARRFPLPPRPS
jgi:hypothetical protein